MTRLVQIAPMRWLNPEQIVSVEIGMDLEGRDGRALICMSDGAEYSLPVDHNWVMALLERGE